eukprot:5402100-Prymnesium_polylepis.1
MRPANGETSQIDLDEASGSWERAIYVQLCHCARDNGLQFCLSDLARYSPTYSTEFDNCRCRVRRQARYIEAEQVQDQSFELFSPEKRRR